MRKTSKEVLTDSVERRMKHIMVQLLNQFDERFPDLVDRQDGRLFKFDIKNQFNDAIRATRDELRDYDIEYRPVRFNPDNTLSVTKAFIEGVERFCFFIENDKPCFQILAGNDQFKILEAIRYEFGAGLIYSIDHNTGLAFELNGLDNAVNIVLPFMDKYKLLSKVSQEYMAWKEKVIEAYTRR